MRPLPRLLLPLLALAVLGAAARAPAAAADDAETPAPPGWWRGAVFYEIFVRSFADATSGPLAGDGVGDLQGLIERLDYLNDGRGAAGGSLGITALWLMPIQPSPSYHGYDVTDYFAVHPQFGDVELCQRFVREAHRRGIRVIIDLVLNHASSRHPLFARAAAAPAGSPERALFRFAPEPVELFGPWEQRVWHPSGEEFYYGVFSPEMPDWNFHEPAVTEHHRRTAEFWLNEVGIDGFRLDAVRYFVEAGRELQDAAETRRWLRDFTAYCHQIKPGSFVVGENTAHSPEIARCIREQALDSAFEFDLTVATLEALRLEAPRLLMRTDRTLDALYAGRPAWSSFLSNHDQERIRNKLDGHEAKMRLAAQLLFTQAGVPFIYYGDELGLSGAKPDPELRTPMPWTGDAPNAGFTRPNVQPWHAVNAEASMRNVAAAQADPQSLLTLYRRLIQLNLSSPALRAGALVDVESDHRRVYAALRAKDRDAALVLANFGSEPIRRYNLSARQSPLARAPEPREEIEGATVAALHLGDGGGFSEWQPVAELAPYSLYVIRWKLPEPVRTKPAPPLKPTPKQPKPKPAAAQAS